MATRNERLMLTDDSRVAVVGAGPAGSLFARRLLMAAAERNVRPKVVLFDKKQFLSEGPPGCNLCAGVVCSELVKRLSLMGIELSPERIERTIEGYWMQTPAGRVQMPHSKDSSTIVSVFRGAGPGGRDGRPLGSFDKVLLEHSLELGAELIPAAVEAIKPAGNNGMPRVSYSTDSETHNEEFDLVVVACGVNSAFLKELEKTLPSYRRPRTCRACQAEIPLPDRFIDARFGNNIHVFALGLKRIRFVSLVPKRGVVTLTIIGRGDLEREDLLDFVRRPELLELMPAGWKFNESFCHCYPAMPISAARKPFGERILTVGDAAISRYCKNGLGSALTTATLAVEAVMEHGVSRDSIKRHFWRPTRKQIARDNIYGRLLLAASDIVTRSKVLSAIYCDTSYGAPEHRVAKTFHQVNWDLVTGERPYREIFASVVSGAFAAGLVQGVTRVISHRLRQFRRSRRAPARVRSAPPGRLGPLHDGQSVAVLGGGPAGASCAIALKRLAARRGFQLDVLLYECKDFETQRQHNQCAGVLSPPISEVLQEDLNVLFPDDLVQRRITNYVLRGPTQSIELGCESEPSLALRRVQFDRYLLREAAASGARIIPARVNDIEINPYEVRIFSDSGSYRVDAVVGAFGLDEGAAQAFRRATGYRPPKCIETMVTKLHPPPETMSRYEQTIYAFLPPIKRVEFAAIIPKAQHLTLVVAGNKLNSSVIDHLLEWPPVREVVRREDCQEDQLEYYKGRFPASRARYICGERYVTVGDAAGLVRPFKGKGVTTACITAHIAATTMADVGISEPAMRRFYAQCSEMSGDIFFGRIVRVLARLASRTRAIDDLIIQAEDDEQLRKAMYCCVSGDGTFRNMLARTVSPGRLWRVSKAVVHGMFAGNGGQQASQGNASIERDDATEAGSSGDRL